MTHSGDEQTGIPEGLDEIIWVTLAKLPEDVRLVIFVIAAYAGGHLRDAKNGWFHILEESKHREVAKYAMEESSCEVDVVGVMHRPEGAPSPWLFRPLDIPAVDGRHFMDVLEPTIGGVIRSFVRGAPARQKCAFAMEKAGRVVDLPRAAALDKVIAGLGWDAGDGGVDLDVSAVALDDQGQEVHKAVFFGNMEERGITHSGDNLTGEGEGDDEQIVLELGAVDPRATQLFFVINIYSKGRSFANVKSPYCRIVGGSGDELCRYLLHEAGGQTGLVIARLFRARGGERWGFQAVGRPSRGNNYKESLPDIQALARVAPQELQLRSGSSATLLLDDVQLLAGAAGHPGASARPTATPPPAAAKQQCCGVQ